ncbi:flavin reductase family protein [Demequina sp. B12]|uniref:flavin reductase family protein n=1 Tax=Demequina sp. B12 TaxID=2992757 RepID=UPI00237A38A5|nr:flavin reductase family protein [Demequina sp. B12]MDE0573687.1 flavin reductase family protein [Demequina sp. B12]
MVSPPARQDHARSLREAFSLYPTGVVALAASIGGERVGMAVNSFTSVSLDPALVAVSAARTSRTWPRLSAAPELGMSVLADHHGDLSRRLASREGDRFAGHRWTDTPGGALLLEGAALWLSCRPHSRFDGGDHEIALYEIVDVEVFSQVRPLVFHQSQYRAIEHPEQPARTAAAS